MKMKAKYILGAVLGLIGATSCNDYFDTVPDEETTLDKTFQSKELTRQYMARIYNRIPNEQDQRYMNGQSGPWTAGSSEAKYSWSFCNDNQVNNGTVNATTGWVATWWREFYKAISQANVFLDRVGENQELTEEERTQYYNEVKALRALLSFYLFRIYGPFVITETSIAPDATAEEMDMPRNSVDECIEWLDRQFTEAAEGGLPVQSDGDGYWGHMTKEVAEAYRAVAWVYAASPLFNGNTYYSDLAELFPQQVDNTKWQKARDYLKKWFDDYPEYKLCLRDVSNNETDDITKADPYNSLRAYQYYTSLPPVEEIIFLRGEGASGMFSYERVPYHSGAPSDYRGGGGIGATQEMVDLYFMADGKRIDDSEEYQEYNYGPGSNPYKEYPGDDVVTDEYLLYKKVYREPLLKKTTFIDGKQEVHGMYYNREPRFYTDITFNQQKWLSATAIYSGLAQDGNSGAGIAGHDFPLTGYVVRKGCTTGATGAHAGKGTMLRLADLYLMYAEALAECANAGIGGTSQYEEALEYVNKVRARAGIPGYAFQATKDVRGLDCIVIPKTYESVRNVVRRERAVELAFENCRYFDVRRWKVSTMAVGDGWVYPTYHQGGEGGDFHGMSVQKPEYRGFYEKTVFETRSFSERGNLFPLPQDDINISDKIRQNTGWSQVD